jgi:hypothetical protein
MGDSSKAKQPCLPNRGDGPASPAQGVVFWERLLSYFSVKHQGGCVNPTSYDLSSLQVAVFGS